MTAAEESPPTRPCSVLLLRLSAWCKHIPVNTTRWARGDDAAVKLDYPCKVSLGGHAAAYLAPLRGVLRTAPPVAQQHTPEGV